jgi:hypothetical protein
VDTPNLFVVSIVGFIIAFAVLGALALIMYLITTMFPERKHAGDAAVVAAVTASHQALFPGTTVTKIEEQP